MIPKGWPMIGISPAECAAQEAWEEGGVKGSIGGKIGAYVYDKVLKDGSTRRLTVDVFPLEVLVELGAWPEAAERDRRWQDGTEAAGLVDEPDLAALIRDVSAGSAPPRT